MTTTKTAALPANLAVQSFSAGLCIYDTDDGDPRNGEHVPRWWPTERCDTEAEIAAAYAAGEGEWHT